MQLLVSLKVLKLDALLRLFRERELIRHEINISAN